MDHNEADMGNKINYSYFSICLWSFLTMNTNQIPTPQLTLPLFKVASFKIVQWAETGQKLRFYFPLIN